MNWTSRFGSIEISFFVVVGLLLFVVAGSALAAGNSASSSGSGAGFSCNERFDIAGTFTERFNCAEKVSGTCLDADIEITGIVVEEGDDVCEYDLTDDNDGMAVGTLSNDVYDWTGNGPGFTEAGEWTFSDEDNFTKESEATITGGTVLECTGTGVRGAGPAGAPAPVGNCP